MWCYTHLLLIPAISACHSDETWLIKSSSMFTNPAKNKTKNFINVKRNWVSEWNHVTKRKWNELGFLCLESSVFKLYILSSRNNTESILIKWYQFYSRGVWENTWILKCGICKMWREASDIHFTFWSIAFITPPLPLPTICNRDTKFASKFNKQLGTPSIAFYLTERFNCL